MKLQAPEQKRRAAGAGGFAAALLAFVSCWSSVSCTGDVTTPSWRPPDVVLISIDTVRADHLPTYGYARETAPRIDALARRAMVFDRAYASAPHTLPSHGSLFTGLYPGRHGLLDRGDTLAPGIATLAELLAGQSYQTAGFVNCYFLAPEFRLDRGFAHWDFAHDVESPRDAEASNERILAWVDALGPGPFFLFAHYFDAHSDWDHLPYDAPEPYQARFAGDPPDGFRVGDGGVKASRWLAAQNRTGLELGEEELRHLVGLYDAGVAYTDAQVGAMLDALEARGRLENAIVILTSDHGEEFADHGKLLHTQVYDELLRVPLLVSLPEMRGAPGPSCRPRPGSPASFAPGRSDALVQHVDLLPSLADCLGVDPPPGAQGTSFLPALVGAATDREAAFLDTPHGWQRGIVRDGWKLIELPKSGRHRLYRLDDDPGELRDVAEHHPERVQELAAELARHRAANEAGRVASERLAVPDEVHEALEALGYLREGAAE